MYKCIIVDDEPHAIEGLKRYITTMPDLEVYNTYADPRIALAEITRGQHMDLIFLDVDMPGISGLELSKEIRKKTEKLIFTTAHSKYGYEAFEADGDAFLLKPYSLAKFVITFNKLFPKKNESDNPLVDDFIFVKSKEENLKLVKVRFKDIIAIESKLNYIRIHIPNKSILTYMSLSEISKRLNGQGPFLQFQRSFIISQDYIEYVEGNVIRMINGINITVGDYYRKDFNEFVNAKLIKARRRN